MSIIFSIVDYNKPNETKDESTVVIGHFILDNVGKEIDKPPMHVTYSRRKQLRGT